MAGHVCPWWLGYFHLGPVRRWIQKPQKLLSTYIETGMAVADLGCGMGFFTIEMARMVGPDGRVVAVDLQPKMISVLGKRAARAGLSTRIDQRVCSSNNLGADDLAGSIDFAFAFYVVHEVPDVPGFMRQVHAMLAGGGRFLLVEPDGRVSEQEFDRTLAAAAEAGLSVTGRPEIRRSRSAVLEKK